MIESESIYYIDLILYTHIDLYKPNNIPLLLLILYTLHFKHYANSAKLCHSPVLAVKNKICIC